jgi:hypothetical protein
LDGLGLAVMMAGGGREEEGEVQRKREPNNWGIIRVGPLLPYAAGKTQVSSHPFGDFYGHTLGWYYFTYYLLCSWDWLMTWVAILLCMCACVSLSLSSFSDTWCGFSFFLAGGSYSVLYMC